MLHLRVIAPEELRDDVMTVLRDNPGATHVVVHRGAALDPPGDEITADIARESANDVVDDLKGLGVKERGAITLEVLDTVLSTRAYRAEDEAEGEPADAVDLGRAGRPDPRGIDPNLHLPDVPLHRACLIAAVGVVTDSPVTIVGAMVVGPEFGPLAALAVALVRRRTHLARRAGPRTADRISVAMAVTAVCTLAGRSPRLGLAWPAPTNSSEVDFIFQVGPFSLVVAMLAGAAGMLSLVSAKSAALVGVFISVTTVPAAGFAVVAATVGDWAVAAQSAAQLAVNLVGITRGRRARVCGYTNEPSRADRHARPIPL